MEQIQIHADTAMSGAEAIEKIRNAIEVNTLYSTIRRWLPSERIIIKQKTDPESEENVAWEKEPACMNMETACQFCPSKDLLLRNMKTYINACQSTCDKLSCYRQERDVDNYIITVHGLKSSSKIIGLNELSELAMEQEMNCHTGKPELAWEHTEELIRLYHNVVEDMKTFLDENSLLKEQEEFERIKELVINASFGQLIAYVEKRENI